MKKIVRSSIYFIIIILLEFAIPLIFGGFLRSLNDIRLILFVNHMMCFIVPAIFFMIITKSNPKEVLRLNKISFKQLGLLVLVTIVSYPIMTSCSVISGLFFKNNISDFITGIQNTPFIVMLLLMAVMPAITEEITIRGIVLSGFEKLSNFKAALITGILFGIFHLDFQQFFYAAVLGVILGYVVRITNSIFSSMTIHFLINGTSVVFSKISQLMPKEQKETVDITALSINEKVSIILVYLAIGIGFTMILYFVLKKLKNVSENCNIRNV